MSGAQGPGHQGLGHRGVVHQGLGGRPPQLGQGERGEAGRGRGRAAPGHACLVQLVT